MPRSVAQVALLLVTIAAAGARSARAGEVTWRPVPEPLLGEVLAAAKEKSDARLAAAATRDQPDAWLVVDALLARGEKDAAAALGRAVTASWGRHLRDYVEVRWDVAEPTPARAGTVAAEQALLAGDSARVLELAQTALPGGDDVVSLRALRVRAAALRSLGRSPEAHAAIADAAGRAERLGALGLLSDLVGSSGEWAFQDGDMRAARAGFKRTIQLREAAGLGRGMTGARLLLAMVLESTGEFEEARRQAEAGLALAEKAGRKGDQAAALGILGNVCGALSDHTRALDYQLRALGLAVEAKDAGAEAATLGNLSTTYGALGDAGRARDHARRALAMFRAQGDRVNEVRARGLLAGQLRAGGEYLAALKEYDAIEAMARALGDTQVEAVAALDRGLLLEQGGSLERAEESYRQALQIAQKTGSLTVVTNALRLLAQLRRDAGDLDGASTYLERAARVWSDQGDRANLTAVRLAQAQVARRRGDEPARAALLAEALAVAEEIGQAGPLSAALLERSEELRAAGKRAEALEVVQRGLRIAERARLQQTVVLMLTQRAVLQVEGGEPALALATARSAVPLVAGRVKGQADEIGASMRSRYASLYDIGLVAAARVGDVVEAAYFMEASRSGSLLESLENRNAILEAGLPEALAEEVRRAQADEVAAQAAYRRAVEAFDREQLPIRAKAVEAAERAVARLRERVQAEAKQVAQVLYPEPAPPEEIQRLLADDEAFVLYAESSVSDTLYAVVVLRGGSRLVSLGRLGPVQEAVAGLPDGAPGAGRPDAAGALHKRVIEPLGLPATVRRVLVAPHGLLAGVPFSVLFGTEDGAREACCLPSATTYAALRMERATAGTKVLALGDPAYPEGGAGEASTGALALLGRARRLQRLPASGEEARAVGDVVLVGPSATRAGLRAALGAEPRWRAVHLACHGLVRLDRGMLSSLALTPTDTDSGLLTAADVFAGWRVPADLVVLSACETSRGSNVRAEGGFGLTRAFLFAGAPRVIVSLWKVDDEATRALMEHLYEGLRAGLTPVRALQRAQQRVRSVPRWSDPFYWAAWMLWGLP